MDAIDKFNTILLDMWAARIQFRTSFISSKYGKCVIRTPSGTFSEYSPTRLWTHGGPLLEGISIEYLGEQGGYMAYFGNTDMGNPTASVAKTQLEAGIRAFVKANMHKYVEAMQKTNAILQENPLKDQEVAETETHTGGAGGGEAPVPLVGREENAAVR